MLKDFEIRVGKSYVNERARMAREVVEEVDDHKVKYNAFDLITGQLISAPFQICFKSQISRWADREANLTEISRFHPFRDQSGFDTLPADSQEMIALELAKAQMQHTIRYNSIYH